MKIIMVCVIGITIGQLIANYPNIYDAIHNAYFNIFGMIGYIVTKYLMDGINE